MPSQKPRIATYTSEEKQRKFKIVAAYQGKSMSEYLEILIDKAITEHEKEYGTIPIKKE